MLSQCTKKILLASSRKPDMWILTERRGSSFSDLLPFGCPLDGTCGMTTFCSIDSLSTVVSHVDLRLLISYIFIANTIPLRAENGAYSNPLYKNSAIGDDLYDRPKSHPTADDLYDRPKSHPTADDLYDRPKSHSTDDEDSDDGEAEGTTVQMPSIESRYRFLRMNLRGPMPS